MIELNYLRHALALAKHRNFRRAAEELYISQPALSRSIQALEAEVGAKLFDRGGREVEPTPLGEMFLAKARGVLQAAGELKREADLVRGLEVGEMAVGCGPYPAEMLMGEALAGFVREYPGVRVRLVVDNWLRLLERLRGREVEFFVAETSEVEQAEDLLVTPLAPRAAYVFCRAGHPLAGRAGVTLGDVLKYPVVCGTLPLRVLRQFHEAAGTPCLAPPERAYPSVDCPYFALHKRVVAGSDTVGFAPFPMVEAELRAGAFVLLPVQFGELRTLYGIVQLQGRTKSPAAGRFADVLVELDRALTARERRGVGEFFHGGRG